MRAGSRKPRTFEVPASGYSGRHLYTEHLTTKKDAMTKESTRDIALENQKMTLRLLARLGYATPRQIALGVWRDVTPSTRKMANRTINALLAQKVIVEKRDDVNSERLVALTKAGVQRLKTVADLSLARDKPHARDWLRHAHAHRTAANSVFVAGSVFVEDWEGETELEIRLGDAEKMPAAHCKYKSSLENIEEHKIADTVLYQYDIEHDKDINVWVEVEQSSRGQRDFAKCIDWLRAMYSKPEPNADEVWFVITAPGANRIGERLKKALTPGGFVEDARPKHAKDLDQDILKKRVKVFKLDADTLNLTAVEL